MQKRTAFFSLLLLVLLCLTAPEALAAGSTFRTAEVNSDASFWAALKDPAVNRLRITTSFEFQHPDGDIALLLPRREGGLTIEGASPEIQLSVQHAGIILGGDVTFRNLKFQFINGVRNAMIANGYTLTLENVTAPLNASFPTVLFGGSVTNYCGSNLADLPAPGSHSKLILRGNTVVGDIFAGSLSDLPGFRMEGSQELPIPNRPNSFPSPVTIIQEPGFKGKIGSIYSCGARENRSSSRGPDWVEWPIRPDLYHVDGPVTICLDHTSVQYLDGRTGSENGNAILRYTDDKNKGPIGNLTVRYLQRLEMVSGKLTPAADSNFLTAELAAGTQLDLTAMTSEASPELVALMALSGQGTLVLRPSQQLFAQTVAPGASFQIAIGSEFLGSSEAVPAQDHIYVMAPLDTAPETFQLLPYSGNPTQAFSLVSVDWADSTFRGWSTALQEPGPPAPPVSLSDLRINGQRPAAQLPAGELSVTGTLTAADESQPVTLLLAGYDVQGRMLASSLCAVPARPSPSAVELELHNPGGICRLRFFFLDSTLFAPLCEAADWPSP